MPRTPTQQQLFAELMDRYGPEIAEAFLEAIRDLRSNVNLQAFQGALERGDIEGAITALNLETAAYEPLETVIRDAYLAGGRAGVRTMPGIGRLIVGFRFDVRNFRAEAWLRDHSSRLITSILEEQRAAVREALGAAMVVSQHPRTTALEIVGRVNRATGAREGGILGLSDPQRAALAKAKAELASGDPEQLQNYLTRERRDRRFDRSITKAIREGQPVPADVAAMAAERYGARLEQLRGETIGRTEALTSLRAAKLESYEQLVQAGHVTADQVQKVWKASADRRTRDTHANLHGKVVGLREPFRSISGAQMMFPGDTSLGAPAAEIVACRCDFAARINWRALAGVS
ncbi:MAG TPA: phage minor head protein [Caulobacter sp.]|nr:phage minor head protein [Caulobacter sp.]